MEMIGQRALEVLWVLSRMQCASEKMVRECLRRLGNPVRNRHEMQRILGLLVRRGLVLHDKSMHVFVFNDKAVYAERKREVERLKDAIAQWEKVYSEREMRKSAFIPWEEEINGKAK